MRTYIGHPNEIEIGEDTYYTRSKTIYFDNSTYAPYSVRHSNGYYCTGSKQMIIPKNIQSIEFNIFCLTYDINLLDFPIGSKINLGVYNFLKSEIEIPSIFGFCDETLICKVTDQCENTFISEPLFVEFNYTTDADVVSSNQNNTVKKEEGTQLKIKPENETLYQEVKWKSKSGLAIFTETSVKTTAYVTWQSNFIPCTDTVYAELKDYCNHEGSSELKVINLDCASSSSEIQYADSFFIYSNGKIRCINDHLNFKSIAVLNLNGQLIAKKATGMYDISTQNILLPDGIYLIEVTLKNGKRLYQKLLAVN